MNKNSVHTWSRAPSFFQIFSSYQSLRTCFFYSLARCNWNPTEMVELSLNGIYFGKYDIFPMFLFSLQSLFFLLYLYNFVSPNN